MNPIPPGIPKGFHLFRFPGDVIRLPILHIPAGGGPLEIGIELDAVGRVDVDALNLSTEPFPFRQGGHDLQAVSQDHAVGPVGFVPVELGFGVAFLFSWYSSIQY